jgi:hypothetical protein
MPRTPPTPLDPRAQLGVHDGPLSAEELADVRVFMETGAADPIFARWEGQSVLARCMRGSDALDDALVEEVLRRTRGHHRLPEVDVVGLTREKVQPMVDGLFPVAERGTVLGVLEKSVIFLTPANVADAIRSAGLPRSAWNVANLYLGSIGADLLGPEADSPLGMSAETTCYVSLEYFRTKDPFDDFVVHEAAHVFHNCKRERIGLPRTRKTEWLLEIDFHRRETFAYACEAYSQIVAAAKTRQDRLRLVERWADKPAHDRSVDVAELVDVVHEAAAARNGWRRILTR